MKMTQEDFQKLSAAIDADADGLTVRSRWTALWAIPNEIREPMMQEFYVYLNDENIDTALRRIFRWQLYNAGLLIGPAG